MVVQRHYMEHMADICPSVQILGAPVPQMVDQLAAVLTQVDSLVPEQVIAVPKLSWPSRSGTVMVGGFCW